MLILESSKYCISHIFLESLQQLLLSFINYIEAQDEDFVAVGKKDLNIL